MKRWGSLENGLITLALALACAQPARAEILAPPPDQEPPPDTSTTYVPAPEPDPAVPQTTTPPPDPSGTSPHAAPPPSSTTTTPPHAAPAPTPPPARRPAAEDDDVDDESDEHSEWFWIEASAGYSWVNLVQLTSDDFTAEPDLLKGSGFIFEGGLGFEISILQIGVTSSYAQYQHFDIVTAELDATLVIPIPIIEPFLRVGVGYAHMGQVEVATMGTTPEKARIHGIGVDLGAGLDIHLADAFQLGFAFDASFLNLQRQKVTELGTITNVDFTQRGNAVGLQLNASVRITFQF